MRMLFADVCPGEELPCEDGAKYPNQADCYSYFLCLYGTDFVLQVRRLFEQVCWENVVLFCVFFFLFYRTIIRIICLQ